MSFISFLQENPTAFLTSIFVLSLLVGSFLNVVIYRLPLILESNWKKECSELLELDKPEDPEKIISLSTPASSCPHCGHKIKPWENIPVISYLLLRGKCSNC